MRSRNQYGVHAIEEHLRYPDILSASLAGNSLVMRLKPFVVILSVKPAVRLPNNLGNLELSFQEPDGPKKVIITKIEEEVAGTMIPTGLRFRVLLSAESIKKAIELAKGLTDGVVSFMTLITGRGMEIPREDIAYELTENTQERDFLQVFYDVPMKEPSRRQADIQLLTDLIDKQLRLDRPLLEHIARAVRWYRLGVMVTDVFDQFNCFWIGLEALNLLLQQKLAVEDDPIACPECKHKWKSTPTVSGIRAFVQDEMKESRDFYRSMRQLRIDIMHSTKELRSLQQSASIYAPRTGEVLFRAVCFLLGFENWMKVAHGAVLREFPMRGELQGLLVGDDPNTLGPVNEDPHFEMHHEIQTAKLEENGSVTYTYETSMTTHVNTNVKFKLKEMRLYGDSETTGAITTKTLRTANGKEIPI